MAQLRGDSKCGGKPIVTLDMLDQVVDDILNVSLETKLNKRETSVVSNTQDELIKDANKNGIYPTELTKLSDGLDNAYKYGTLLNLNTNNSRFQMYAPHKQEDSSSLFIRTGWDNDIKKWERVITKPMMDKELNKKFDKTGGDITGRVHISQSASIQDTLYVKNFLDLDGHLRLGSNDYGRLYTDTSKTSLAFKGSALHVYENDAKFNGFNIWHSGNLTPNEYVKKIIKLPPNTDLMDVEESGFYTCESTNGTGYNIGDKTYIEVIKHDANNVLQKAYSLDGSRIITRTKHDGAWTPWRAIGLSISHNQAISLDQWRLVDGLYEYTVHHKMGSSSITSATITDSNGVSIFTGFQVVSDYITKIFSNTAINGKIVLHATT